MANFNIAFKKTMNFEGGYVNDKDDNGGETKYGISKKAFPSINIRELTLNEAKDIYKKNYWDKIKGDDIKNQDVANILFDTAVNIGVVGSIKLAQKVLDIKDDGIFGPITLRELNNYKSEEFIDKYKLARIQYYIDICRKKKSNKKFFYGWVKRVMEV